MVQNLTEVLASVVASPAADQAVAELAGELTAEYARFNHWVYERKPRSSAAELWNLAAAVTRHRCEVEAAWKAPAGREALLSAMTQALDGLRRMRETDSVEFDDPSMPPEIRQW